MKNRIVGVSTSREYLNREQFALYAENGIGAFELSVNAEYYECIDPKQIAADANAEGVDSWSFHLPFYYFPGADIAKLDETERKASVAFQSEWLKRIADAGFHHAVIHPSDEPIADADRAVALEHSKQSIAELAQVAKREGIILAVEDLPRSCLGNCSKEIAELISLDDSVGVCFDTNHLLLEPIEGFVRRFGDRIVTLHVSDYDFVDERHWLPGEGKINWADLMDTLDAIGYDGVLMYEVNRGSCPTITRETPLTPADFRQNADELFFRAPLTKRGTVLL